MSKSEINNLLLLSDRINLSINVLENSLHHDSILIDGICFFVIDSFVDFFRKANLRFYKLSVFVAPDVFIYYDDVYKHKSKSNKITTKKINDFCELIHKNKINQKRQRF